MELRERFRVRFRSSSWTREACVLTEERGEVSEELHETVSGSTDGVGSVSTELSTTDSGATTSQSERWWSWRGMKVGDSSPE